MIAQVQYLNAGVRPEADGGAADLKLRAGTAIGPEPIAANQWTIAHYAKPLVLARRRVAHLALGMAQVGHTPRRISVGRARGRRYEQREQQHAREGKKARWI